MQYWYDQQVRRYILQFIRLFDDFSIKTGKKNNSDSNSYIRVPVRYADMSRMVAHILRHNSENVMNSCPFMSAYITNLQIARDRLQEPRLVDKVQVAERKYDTSSTSYTAEIGNTYCPSVIDGGNDVPVCDIVNPNPGFPLCDFGLILCVSF